MTPSEIEIIEVEKKSDLLKFIKFPWKIYNGNPAWVPPLIADRKEFFDKEKNPFYRFASVKLFLARRQGELVGRIGICINHAYNEIHQDKVGFFGFFETIDDYNVAKRLLKVAMIHLSKEGMEVMRGPANFSANHDIGLLLDAYDLPPAVMMTYNPPYYVDLLERYGFQKVKDFYAYKIVEENKPPERVEKIIERIKKRSGATFRSLRMNDFKNEINQVIKIYNDAWEDNWGFVPLSHDEFTHIAKSMKQIVDPDLVLIAEIDGEPVGFSLALPDINQALLRINGRLFPFGLIKLLWHTKIRNKVNRLRVITMGVSKKFQKRGIDNIFYYDTFYKGIKKGYIEAELSWILEDNDLMISAVETLGAKRYKTYRMYEAPLTSML